MIIVNLPEDLYDGKHHIEFRIVAEEELQRCSAGIPGHIGDEILIGQTLVDRIDSIEQILQGQLCQCGDRFVHIGRVVDVRQTNLFLGDLVGIRLGIDVCLKLLHGGSTNERRCDLMGIGKVRNVILQHLSEFTQRHIPVDHFQEFCDLI